MTAVSKTHSIPAPVGGLNSRDSIAAMEESDALTLENWFCEPTDIRMRKGYAQHVTGITGQVESLMPYSKIDGTQTLFCAANSAFYNVTSAGAVGSPVVSSLTNNRWQSVNYTNASSVSYLCCFNGADKPQYWDGTTWTAVDGVSTPAITGVTTTGLINASVHKRRLWLTEKDQLKAWYLPVDAVGGAATEYEFSGIAQKGGYLLATESWTLDAGDGVDDYFIAVTSEGEVICYRGTDPSDATKWLLVGVWEIAIPIGRRCLHKFGGDLLVITKEGIIPLSRYLISAGTSTEKTLTFKINQNVTEDAQSYSGNFGWQLMTYRNANMLLLNVPVSEGSNQKQYAMNTITGAWSVFTGLAANCWEIHNGEPYYGDNTLVNQFWGVLADNSTNITATVKPAFSYFGSRGRIKQWKMMRPIFSANGAPSIRLGLNVDFEDKDIQAGVSFASFTAGVWDTSVWDSGEWGGGLEVSRIWASVNAVGIAASPKIICEAQGIDLFLEAIDFIYEEGGAIG